MSRGRTVKKLTRDEEDFMLDLLEYFDDLLDQRKKPDTSEVQKMLKRIGDKYGIKPYRKGTNRTIYKFADGYIYKVCHDLSIKEDNIREYHNSAFAENNPELIDYLALATKFFDQSEYILQEEAITPLHELVDVSEEQSEAKESLFFLLEYKDNYDFLINRLNEFFILADISPKSIFNYGVKNNYNGEPVLAILDHGYLVPKPVIGGWVECPVCGGELVYDKLSLSLEGRTEDKLLKDVKAQTAERYKCENSSCKHHKSGIIASRVAHAVERGEIAVLADNNDGYEDEHDRRDDRPRRENRGGFNR